MPDSTERVTREDVEREIAEGDAPQVKVITVYEAATKLREMARSDLVSTTALALALDGYLQAFLRENMAAERLARREVERERDALREKYREAYDNSMENFGKFIISNTRAESAETRLLKADAVVEAVRENVKCPIHYVDRPAGFTCLDDYEQARTGRGRYTSDYREKLARGEELCPACRVRKEIAAYDATRTEDDREGR